MAVILLQEQGKIYLLNTDSHFERRRLAIRARQIIKVGGVWFLLRLIILFSQTSRVNMGNQQGGAKTTFSPLHGSNIELLRDGSVATRKDKRNPTNAVLYTEQPIPVGCKFEIKLEEKAKYSFSSNLVN